jgi:hypothetical protein
MVEAKLLRKKLKNGLIVDKWDLVTIIEKQQAEIEALKKEAALQRLSDFTQEAESFDRTASHMAGEYVSYKPELTDEEIIEICIEGGMYDCINDPYFKPNGNYSLDLDLIRFARAILRKAQEK